MSRCRLKHVQLREILVDRRDQIRVRPARDAVCHARRTEGSRGVIPPDVSRPVESRGQRRRAGGAEPAAQSRLCAHLCVVVFHRCADGGAAGWRGGVCRREAV